MIRTLSVLLALVSVSVSVQAQDEVVPLSDHFLTIYAGEYGHGLKRIDSDALKILRHYDWPGNVRELENALERAAVVATGSSVTRDSLPERVREAPPTRLAAEPIADNPTMEVIERAYILWVLQAEGGNKSRAAEVLGIDPSTLYRKLNRYGIAE